MHVERRYTNGFSVIGSYTFMKEFGVRTVDNYTVMMINNLRHSYGAEGYPHRAVVSYVYELPFGKGKRLLSSLNPVLDRVVGGWQINGITTLRSGGYQSVDSNVNNGAGSRANNRADATGIPAVLPVDQRSTARWFNPAAFVDPPFTRYGTSGVGVYLGPGSVNFDMSAFKNTRLSEGKKLQFRAEAFNALNSVNLNNPNVERERPSASEPSPARPRRGSCNSV